ncbi:DUF7261 family protein [Halomarina litorea]|uniref:DUF7261 family protein n=1 Tax=Halomarina litorea TaxID=2961595 RepID=UPI0020C4C38D|nr:hypothetical protein [Halomarina sp. BCD28]
MAAVSARERGQLILVAGLSLAVVLVTLALVLNTAIYTENVASREVDSGARDALEAHHAAVEGTGVVMDGANDRSSPLDYGTLESRFGTNVRWWSENASSYTAFNGRSLRVSSTGDVVHGVRVVDRTSGHFLPRDGNTTDWTVASSVHVRDFEMTVTSGASVDETTVSDELDDGTWSEETFFSVDFDDGDWRMAVYNDSSVSELTVGVYDGTSFATCPTTSTSELRIDVGEGTVNGVRCDALATIESVSGPYDVHFANGDTVTGTYELTVDRTIDGTANPNGTFTDAVDRANYGSFCGSPSTYYLLGKGYPAVSPALYAGTVNISYHAESIEYDDPTVRVAPGELGAAAATPQVTSFIVDDLNNSSNVRFGVTWTAADPDDSLGAISTTLYLNDTSGTRLDSATGGATGGPETLTGPILPGGDYDISIVVTDTAGNTRKVTQRHHAEADGNDTGCPP